MDNKTFFNNKRTVTLSGVDYEVSDITLGDIADFETYCDEYKKKRLIATFKLCGQTPDVNKIIDVAATEEERDKMMEQIHGMIFLIHKILSKHQKVSIEDVQERISIADLKIVMDTISEGLIDQTEQEKNAVAGK